MTVETTLRLEAISRTGFDARLARLGGGKLMRTGDAAYLQCDRGIQEVIHHLAFAGVRASPCSGVPWNVSGLRPAVAFDLVPLDDTLRAVDVVEVRQIQLSAASAALMHRPIPWLHRRLEARDACLRLLREEDAVLGWRRIVWGSVATLRAARARIRMRPVVFDTAAVERQPLRWTYANEGAIERWAFG